MPALYDLHLYPIKLSSIFLNNILALSSVILNQYDSGPERLQMAHLSDSKWRNKSL